MQQTGSQSLWLAPFRLSLVICLDIARLVEYRSGSPEPSPLSTGIIIDQKNIIGKALLLFRDFPYDCIENITIFAA